MTQANPPSEQEDMGMILGCRCCGAKYDPAVRWSYGRYAGTSMSFTTYGHIKPGHCPVCRTPPINLLEPTWKETATCM